MTEWINGVWEATAVNPHIWGMTLALPLLIIGLAGTVLPVLPGTLILVSGFVVYGLVAGFDELGVRFWLMQAILVSLSYLLDFLATAFGVKVWGGSRAAMWGALLGSLMIFVLGPLGLIVGPFAGAVLGELLMGAQMHQALRSGFGSFVGFLGGAMAKILIGCVMVGLFLFRLG
ncbi:MAG: hypothetical protein CSA34_07480 [Desulfobulbus propionicus]|nr:MAG: hypothetical protein CSA34_07480 [Desulfobulbus propionicus]